MHMDSRLRLLVDLFDWAGWLQDLNLLKSLLRFRWVFVRELAITELVSTRLIALDLVFKPLDKDHFHRLRWFKQVIVSTFLASLQSPDPTSCSFLALLAVVVFIVILAEGNQR